MRNRRNYYRVLHVQPDAPPAVIRASYRAIMQRLTAHPDLGGDHERAALLNEAFDTLSDPARRAAYDRSVARPVDEQRRRPGPARAAPLPGPVCAFCDARCSAVDIGRRDGVCVSCGSALFPARRHQAGGGSRRALERAPRRLPLTFRLAATPHTLWTGTTEDLSLNGMRVLSPVTIRVGERVRIDCDFCTAVGVVTGRHAVADHARGALHYGVEFLTLLVKRARGGLVSTDA